MKRLFKIAGGLLVVVLAIVMIAVMNPVLASRFIWPVIEGSMLDEPFVGITEAGVVEPNLFRIQATGVNTAPIVDAARRFIFSLDEEQQGRLMFPVDDLEWRRWANIHISTRQGVGLLDMDSTQTEAAFQLLETSLSARGFETARSIMKLEGHLADLMDDHNQYGERRYWLTIMGEPSISEPWGWQIDGHHLIINFFVLGSQVVMTPTFMGSEPPRATTGRFAGTSILEEEQQRGLEFINSLTPVQQTAAIIEPLKLANNNRGELFQDNAIVPYQGLLLSDLNKQQSEQAIKLISLYIDNLRPAQAEIKRAEIVRHWNETYFSWVGGIATDSVFYYRIHSPVVMIEFDHQSPIALEGPDQPSRNHIHTVVRTPNGNDYGKDLLRQHLESHAH